MTIFTKERNNMYLEKGRSFFRIDVMLPCSYRIIPEDRIQDTPLPSTPDASYIEQYFMENLSQLDEQLHDYIVQIGQKSVVLANALTTLNSKLNFVLQTIDKKQLGHAMPQQMVNISAGGMAISIRQSDINPKDKVDLLFQLMSNEAPILVRCKIVKIFSSQDDSNETTVALEYENLSEEDRRKLVYFIQNKEIEMARQQNKSNH